MKAISLTQPRATLVAIGAKHNETRSWGLSHRLPITIAIHAAKGLGPVGGKRGYKNLCFTEPFLSVLSLARQNRSDVFYLVDYFMSLPFGAIVAVVDVVALARVDYYKPQPDDADQWCGPFLNFGSRGEKLPDEPELSFGDYSVGRFVWNLSNIRALPEPVPAKGVLGLWELDEVTLAAVKGQLEAVHA